MAQPGSIVQFAFAGLDTLSDPEALPVGALTKCENASFASPGRIEKRAGLDILNSQVIGGGQVTGSVGMFSFNNELINLDGKRLFTWISSDGKWADKGACHIASVTNKWVLTNTYEQLNGDCCIVSGSKFFACEDSRGGIRLSVKDVTTDTSLFNDIALSAGGSSPKCTAWNNHPLVTFIDQTYALKGQAISIDAPSSIGTPFFFAGDVNNEVYDAFSEAQELFIAYGNIAGNFTVSRFDTSNPSSAAWTTEVTGTVASTCITVFPDQAGNVCVINASGSHALFTVINPTNGSVISAPQVISASIVASSIVRVCAINNQSNIHVFFEEKSNKVYNQAGVTPNDARVDHAIVSVSGSTYTTSAAQNLLLGHGLASKPFVYKGDVNVFVASDSADQSTLFVVNDGGETVARSLSSDANGTKNKSSLPNVNVLGDQFICATERKGNIEIDASNGAFTIARQVGSNETRLTLGVPASAVTISNNLVIAGARGSTYDGAVAVEQGFDQVPEIRSEFFTGVAGNIDAGTYEYAFTYAWTDNFGQIHESGPSDPVTFNNDSGDNVRFVVSNLRTTSKKNVRIVGYRSLKNPTAGDNGTITLQRFTSATNPYINNTNADTQDIIDTATNASVEVASALYSSVGELSNIPMPSCTQVAVFKNRVFMSGLEDDRTIAFSKLANRAGVPVEFAGENTLTTDAVTGPITAIKGNDNNLIVFKRNFIHALAGEGPDNTGNNSDYQAPQIVSSLVGCVEPRSVALTSVGLMFKSAHGIYLLDRSLQFQFIGSGVSGFNDLTVTSATVVNDSFQVRFTTLEGPTLVYNYNVNQWSTFTYPPLEGSCLWNGTFAGADTRGFAYTENASSFSDAGEFVKLRLQTGWLAPAGLLSYCRVRRLWLLGSYKGPHTLSVLLEYDGIEASPKTAYTFNATNIVSGEPYGNNSFGAGPYGGAPLPYQFGLIPATQRCRSLRFTLEDVQSSSFNEGLSLKSLAMEVATLQGLNRIANKARS